MYYVSFSSRSMTYCIMMKCDMTNRVIYVATSRKQIEMAYLQIRVIKAPFVYFSASEFIDFARYFFFYSLSYLTGITVYCGAKWV